MSESDLKINGKVRKIFIENNLDTSCLGTSTTSGSVLVKGELRKINREMRDRDIVLTLGVLETVIMRTKGVKRVKFAVRNWKKKKGKWQKEETPK